MPHPFLEHVQRDAVHGGFVAKTEHRKFALGGNIWARDGEDLEADWLRLLERSRI